MHNESTNIKKRIPVSLKRNGQTVRTIFEILTQLLKLKSFRCENYGAEEMIKEKLYSDPYYKFQFLNKLNKPPPASSLHSTQTQHFSNSQSSTAMFQIHQIPVIP